MRNEKIESLKLLASRIDIKINKTQELINGFQFSLEQKKQLVHLTIFNNGNCLVQGKESNLKDLINKWANKNLEDVVRLYPDYGMSWKEWHYEAKDLVEYIQKNGEPKEDEAPHKYKIKREVMFHDYMFRNSSHENLTMDKISFVLKSWTRRFCFMNLDVENILTRIKDNIMRNYSYSGVNENNIPFGLAVEGIARYFSESCHEKFIGNGKCHFCPQVKTESYPCISEIIDSLYIYCEDQQVLAYTKNNFKNLLKRKPEFLTWHKLAPASPIEEIMGKSLIDAGILSVPQFQAYSPEHKYRLDFVIKTSQGLSIAIECDGLEFHANAATYIRDRVKDRYLQQRGFYMMRFSSVEIFNQIDKCVKEIDEAFWRIQKGKLTLDTEKKIRYFGIIDEE